MSIQNIRLEVMQLLEKKIDSFMEEFLIPVEKIWQPTDLLPDSNQENFLE
jgi:acyl-[acyl-carrier-protein] desaturase